MQYRLFFASEPTPAPDAEHSTTEPPAVTPVAGETHATTEASGHDTGHAAPGGLGAIGIDGKALVFQLINFAILLFVLKKVAYKPILKALGDRQKKIDESIKAAAEIERSRQEIAEEQ